MNNWPTTRRCSCSSQGSETDQHDEEVSKMNQLPTVQSPNQGRLRYGYVDAGGIDDLFFHLLEGKNLRIKTNAKMGKVPQSLDVTSETNQLNMT